MTSTGTPRAWITWAPSITLLGIGIAVMIAGGNGVSPIDSTITGTAATFGTTPGTCAPIVTAILLTIPRLAGANVRWPAYAGGLVLGLVIDTTLRLLHQPVGPISSAGYTLAGIAIIAVASTGLYHSHIGEAFGETWTRTFTGRRTRGHTWNPTTVRVTLELSLVAIGAAFGGQIGWGTLVYALSIGRAVTWCIHHTPTSIARVATGPTPTHDGTKEPKANEPHTAVA